MALPLGPKAPPFTPVDKLFERGGPYALKALPSTASFCYSSMCGAYSFKSIKPFATETT